ncbi:peptide deformylase 1A, chloroplastic [Impatiens glandulifera]|uniref:peptide deformylase 1A, chloroplastic n=1 Tax=Impatiens glandulifera TaxID=253017 RepID=UPI001FB10186|nr:peptide deformylase 1A, chloroplastic [Impatiens glandulifera]
MEGIQRIANSLSSIPLAGKCSTISSIAALSPRIHNIRSNHSRTLLQNLRSNQQTSGSRFNLIPCRNRTTSLSIARAGWFLGLGEKKQMIPEIVKAGDPVLHEQAQEVPSVEIESDKIQKIIDDMILAMRKTPGVGLAAPQIGVPLQIIVVEDTKEYISYAPKELTKAQDRRPFDLRVVINPKLEKIGNRTALFFEGCLSVDGYRAVVERHLEVKVTGLDREGQAIIINASGWQARILQHECDHLSGTLYVDKMVKKTFRVVENLELPLPIGCPKLGAT